MGIHSFRRTIESPCRDTPLSQHQIAKPSCLKLAFTLSTSVEVNAKSEKVNAHRDQNSPKLWAFTLSVDHPIRCPWSFILPRYTPMKSGISLIFAVGSGLRPLRNHISTKISFCSDCGEPGVFALPSWGSKINHHVVQGARFVPNLAPCRYTAAMISARDLSPK